MQVRLVSGCPHCSPVLISLDMSHNGCNLLLQAAQAHTSADTEDCLPFI